MSLAALSLPTSRTSCASCRHADATPHIVPNKLRELPGQRDAGRRLRLRPATHAPGTWDAAVGVCNIGLEILCMANSKIREHFLRVSRSW